MDAYEGLNLAQLWIAQQDLDRAIDRAVRDARAGGQSWSQIGSQLGITKQGAAQRYGKHDTP